MHYRILSLLTALIMAGSLTACGKSTQEAEQTQSKETTPFDTYVSNTYVSTGANMVVTHAESVTYRCWLPVEKAGQFDYCFYISNVVDSTFERGKKAYVNEPGGEWTIESAYIADGGTELDENMEPAVKVPVTFDGETTKVVTPSEAFWTDTANLNVEEGHYLLWEWTISGDTIPANRMSDIAYSYSHKGDSEDGFTYCGDIPLPKFIGVDRDVEARIVTLGDSITQGCGATNYSFDYWVAQTYQQLDADKYALWNTGLGYARASDCATDGDWLERSIAAADVMTVAFSTNDLVVGPYGGNGADSADAIETNVRSIVQKVRDRGVKTILFNSPPFDFTDDIESIRTDYNTRVEGMASDLGATYFDIASILADPNDSSATVNGQHPDGTGCKLIADALVPVLQETLEEN